jgi:hypothetical protein
MTIVKDKVSASKPKKGAVPAAGVKVKAAPGKAVPTKVIPPKVEKVKAALGKAPGKTKAAEKPAAKIATTKVAKKAAPLAVEVKKPAKKAPLILEVKKEKVEKRLKVQDKKTTQAAGNYKIPSPKDVKDINKKLDQTVRPMTKVNSKYGDAKAAYSPGKEVVTTTHGKNPSLVTPNRRKSI